MLGKHETSFKTLRNLTDPKLLMDSSVYKIAVKILNVEQN